MKIINRIASCIIHAFLRSIAVIYINLFYQSIWNYRDSLIQRKNRNRYSEYLYYYYLEHYGSWIGLGAQIITPPHIAPWTIWNFHK